MDVRVNNRALLAAVQRGDVEEFGKLIGGDHSLLRMSTPFGSWLHVAASAGQLRMVKYLMQCGLNPNERGGTLGGGALNLAASNGHADIVEFLLTTGADLDVSKPECNPLFGAIYGGHMDIVLLLLRAGIDSSIRYSGENMKNMDAINFARERGRLDLADVIYDWRRS